MSTILPRKGDFVTPKAFLTSGGNALTPPGVSGARRPQSWRGLRIFETERRPIVGMVVMDANEGTVCRVLWLPSFDQSSFDAISGGMVGQNITADVYGMPMPLAYLNFYGLCCRSELVPGTRVRLAGAHNGRFTAPRRIYEDDAIIHEGPGAPMIAPVAWLRSGVAGQEQDYPGVITHAWCEHRLNIADPQYDFAALYVKVRFDIGQAQRASPRAENRTQSDVVLMAGSALTGAPPPDHADFALPDEIEVEPQPTTPDYTDVLNFLAVTGTNWGNWT